MLQCVAGEWQILSVDLVIAGDPGFAYVRLTSRASPHCRCLVTGWTAVGGYSILRPARTRMGEPA
jgi:hypothetical protein